MQKSVRPTILSICCTLGYLWVVITIPAVFSPDVKRLGQWYPAIFGLITALYFIAYVGLWHMKKWGAHLLSLVFFSETILLSLLDKINFLGVIILSFSLIISIIHYKKMDENL